MRAWLWRTGAVLVLGAAIAAPLLASSSGPAEGPPSRPPTSHRPIAAMPPDVPQPSLEAPGPLAVLADGDLLIVNGNDQILERAPDGRLSVFAGTGRSGFSGDDGPATDAQFDHISGIAVVPGTDSVLVADAGNNRIREIVAGGFVTTLVAVNHPSSIAVGPQGQVAVTDQAGLQELTPEEGKAITLIPGPSVSDGVIHDLTVDGNTFAFFPDAVAFDGSGAIYVADSSPKYLLEYSDGAVHFVGGSATSAEVYVSQAGLASDGGRVVIADYGSFGISAATQSGLSPVAQEGTNGLTKITGGFRPSGVAVGPNGEIYASDDGLNGATNEAFLIEIDPGGSVHALPEPVI